MTSAEAPAKTPQWFDNKELFLMIQDLKENDFATLKDLVTRLCVKLDAAMKTIEKQEDVQTRLSRCEQRLTDQEDLSARLHTCETKLSESEGENKGNKNTFAAGYMVIATLLLLADIGLRVFGK